MRTIAVLSSAKRVLRLASVCLALGAVLPAPFAQAQTLSRGPYLQNCSTSAVTVRWRTSTATDSVVRYGTSPTSLTSTVSDAASVTEHELRLTGLAADTTYYYSVGTSTTTLASGADYFVVTAPTAAKPTRIWVLGDPGTGSSSQAAVRDAYYNYTGTRHTDLWLMLGDNAYSSGIDAEYTANLFGIYPTMLRKSVLWPTYGNHDAASSDSASQTGPYYAQHTLPKQGEAGGVASGTEAYYSFNYGNIHFVCLDSAESSRTATSPMHTWLESDLANNTKDWTIAFWHHPPYSKGSHNSDTETELIEMRTNFLPLLESYGVDLVLCGHSHSYERSFFLDGHYGSSSTFNTSYIVQPGGGQGAGAYTKTGVGPIAHSGAVYAVPGSSGQTSGGTLNHPAMFISLNVLGSMVLDINGSRLDATFLDSTGGTRDTFSIVKGSGTPPPAPAAPVGLTATAASNNQINLSWTASTGASSYNVKRATVSGGPYTTIATGVTATTFSDTGLAASTTYYYVVSATNSGGESANSLEASATTQAAPSIPPAPTGLTATAKKQPGRIGLTWSASTGATSYNVKRATVSGGPYTTVATGVTTTSYTNTGLATGTTYYYVVSAVNAAGESSNSAQASATAK
jgi:hypothetical protein